MAPTKVRKVNVAEPPEHPLVAVAMGFSPGAIAGIFLVTLFVGGGLVYIVRTGGSLMDSKSDGGNSCAGGARGRQNTTAQNLSSAPTRTQTGATGLKPERAQSNASTPPTSGGGSTRDRGNKPVFARLNRLRYKTQKRNAFEKLKQNGGVSPASDQQRFPGGPDGAYEEMRGD
jgi:hypothetical protein